MHPKIVFFVEELKKKQGLESFSALELMESLRELGANGVQAQVVLLQGFGISIEESEDICVQTKMFPGMSYSEIAAEIMEYL